MENENKKQISNETKVNPSEMKAEESHSGRPSDSKERNATEPKEKMDSSESTDK